LFDLVVDSGCEHIDKTTYIHFVEIYRFPDAAGNGAEGSLVAYIINAGAGLLANINIADIAFDEFKGAVLLQDGQVRFETIRHIVEYPYFTGAVLQQVFGDVTSDKTGASCHEKGGGAEVFAVKTPIP